MSAWTKRVPPRAATPCAWTWPYAYVGMGVRARMGLVEPRERPFARGAGRRRR